MADFTKNFAAIKGQFFDKQAVTSAVDKAARQSLSRAGAFVRTRARSSIRKRKAVSAPGSPPSSHEGSLKKLLYFSWDAIARSVVVGPVPFREGVAPRLLESGGATTIDAKRAGKRVVFVRPRPFMKPAFESERPKMAELFKDTIRGA